jgi:hypothetical protein
MRDDLIGELLRHLQGRDDWSLGRCPKTVAVTLQTLGLPLGLTRLLVLRWVNRKHVYVGKYLLLTASEIADDPWLLVFVAQGMVPIGRAPSGDFLVLRFAKNHAIEVGLANAQFSRAPHTLHAPHEYAPVMRSLDEFLLRIADGLFVPSDFESARQWTELHHERARASALAS